jgi:hypothetical protein
MPGIVAGRAGVSHPGTVGAPVARHARTSRRRVPDWLIGLVLAVVVVAILWFVLGVGDDPTLGA